jgi:hypothetical protein
MSFGLTPEAAPWLEADDTKPPAIMKNTVPFLCAVIPGLSFGSPDTEEQPSPADGGFSTDTQAVFNLKPNNPIIPNRGVNDPHIRIIDGKAYLSATHDKSSDNTTFIMEDWWLWSSDDLVEWELVSALRPEDTYIGTPFSDCWATDFVERNGKYYWYFSEGNRQAGVVVGDDVTGPWKDPLGKPLLPADLTPTHEYDISILEDAGGVPYIVFGVWDFYIAELNEDMISLAETPRKIEIKAADLKSVTIEIHDGSPEGEILVSYQLDHQPSDIFGFDFPAQRGVKDLCFLFRGEEEDLLLFDSFSFK